MRAESAPAIAGGRRRLVVAERRVRIELREAEPRAGLDQERVSQGGRSTHGGPRGFGRAGTGCTMPTVPERRSHPMAIVAPTQPHPIFLAGRWVESPDVLVIDNPADRHDPRRHDLQRDRGAVRGGGRGRRRRLRGHPQAARLRARRASCARSAPGIRARREELGRLIALEAGKPIRDALVEVDRAVLTFRLGAEEAERMTGELIPLDLMPSSKDRIGITRRFPIGPIAGDQPVQLPAQPGRPQAGAGDRDGQPDRPQAAVQGSADDADRGRDHRGRRRARGLRVASCR